MFVKVCPRWSQDGPRDCPSAQSPSLSPRVSTALRNSYVFCVRRLCETLQMFKKRSKTIRLSWNWSMFATCFKHPAHGYLPIPAQFHSPLMSTFCADLFWGRKCISLELHSIIPFMSSVARIYTKGSPLSFQTLIVDVLISLSRNVWNSNLESLRLRICFMKVGVEWTRFLAFYIISLVSCKYRNISFQLVFLSSDCDCVLGRACFMILIGFRSCLRNAYMSVACTGHFRFHKYSGIPRNCSIWPQP